MRFLFRTIRALKLRDKLFCCTPFVINAFRLQNLCPLCAANLEVFMTHGTTRHDLLLRPVRVALGAHACQARALLAGPEGRPTLVLPAQVARVLQLAPEP